MSQGSPGFSETVCVKTFSFSLQLSVRPSFDNTSVSAVIDSLQCLKVFGLHCSLILFCAR